jgi:hypothetical protein
MPVIGDAAASYIDSLGISTDEFLNDVEEMENEGLSPLEILAVLAALDIAAYFVEDLGMVAGINSYIGATESILTNMPFSGAATEAELLALQDLQRATIIQYTGHVGATVRNEISKGVIAGATKREIKEAIKRHVVTNDNGIKLITETALADYRQSVAHVMSQDQPKSMKYFYIGPMDDRTRPICREILSGMPYTKAQIDTRFPGAFIDRGGPRCRHHWQKMSPDKILVDHRNEARRRIAELKKAKRYKKPQTIQQYYDNRTIS